jgi:hypothetical protein
MDDEVAPPSVFEGVRECPPAGDERAPLRGGRASVRVETFSDFQ